MKTPELYDNSNLINLNQNLELLLKDKDIKIINFAKQIVKSLRKQVLYLNKDHLLEVIELDSISPENAYFALSSVYKASKLKEPLLPSDFFKPIENKNDFVLMYLKVLDSHLMEILINFLFPPKQAEEIWSNRLPLISRL